MATTSERRQYRVLILVPVVSRDFEGHALVAYHLHSRYGHDVEFCNANTLHEKMLSFAPDVLVLDRLDTRSERARLAKRLGMKVVLLPTLGFVQDGLDTEELRAGKNEGGREILDCCFTWGEHSRRLLLEQDILAASQVHTVGSPRFDLYHHPYLTLVEPRAELLRRSGVIDDGAPLIVWTTNAFHTLNELRESAVARAVETGVPEHDFRGQIDDEGTAFHDIAQLVTELARRHPGWRFLMKLHPSEKRGPYESLADGFPNLHVLRDAAIRDVLYHCDALLTHCSTTATEAWMLGKPVLEVIFGDYKVASPREYLAGNHVVVDLPAVEALLERYVGNRDAQVPDEQQCVREEYLSRLYYRIDGRASERCAEQIEMLLAPARHDPEQQGRLRRAAAAEHARWQESDDQRMANRLKRALGLSRDQSLRFWTRYFWDQLLGRELRRPWEEEVTPEMVRACYERFHRAARQGSLPPAGAVDVVAT